MEQTREMVEAKIKELGGTIEGGINWDWAMFPTLEAGHAFNNWLGGEWETCGVYPAGKDNRVGVRYR